MGMFSQLKYNNKSYTQMCQAWAAFLLLCAVTATATFLAGDFSEILCQKQNFRKLEMRGGWSIYYELHMASDVNPSPHACFDKE